MARLELWRVPGLGAAMHRFGFAWHASVDSAVSRRILRGLEATGDSEAGWDILDVRTPSWPGGVYVVLVGPRPGPSRLALKFAHTPEGEAALRRQQTVQRQLHEEPRLAGWNSLVPLPLREGRLAGQRWFAEQALAGDPAIARLADPVAYGAAVEGLASTIGELHRRTAREVTIDATVLTRWVDGPLETIRSVRSTATPRPELVTLIGRLRDRLWRELEGRTVEVSWIHGDYQPTNLLLVRGESRPSGIFDWEDGGPDELPVHDALRLILHTPGDPRGVTAMLALAAGRRDWTPEEARVLEAARKTLPSDGIPADVLVMLYGVRRAARTLARSPHLARAGAGRTWAQRDLAPLLEAAALFTRARGRPRSPETSTTRRGKTTSLGLRTREKDVQSAAGADDHSR